jgi:hypothetical protein
MIFSLEHLLQSIPPYGLSGRFFVLAILCILYGLSLGTPQSTLPHSLHIAFDGFLIKWCSTVLPPGVFRNTLRNVLDLWFGFTIILSLFLQELGLVYKGFVKSSVNAITRYLWFIAAIECVIIPGPVHIMIMPPCATRKLFKDNYLKKRPSK